MLTESPGESELVRRIRAACLNSPNQFPAAARIASELGPLLAHLPQKIGAGRPLLSVHRRRHAPSTGDRASGEHPYGDRYDRRTHRFRGRNQLSKSLQEMDEPLAVRFSSCGAQQLGRGAWPRAVKSLTLRLRTSGGTTAMKRREFITLAGGVAAGWPLGALAQQTMRSLDFSAAVAGNDGACFAVVVARSGRTGLYRRKKCQDRISPGRRIGMTGCPPWRPNWFETRSR